MTPKACISAPTTGIRENSIFARKRKTFFGRTAKMTQKGSEPLLWLQQST